MFSLETEGLRDFTDCRDLKAVICVHMTTRAFQHIPAQLFLVFIYQSSFLGSLEKKCRFVFLKKSRKFFSLLFKKLLVFFLLSF